MKIKMAATMLLCSAVILCSEVNAGDLPGQLQSSSRGIEAVATGTGVGSDVTVGSPMAVAAPSMEGGCGCGETVVAPSMDGGCGCEAAVADSGCGCEAAAPVVAVVVTRAVELEDYSSEWVVKEQVVAVAMHQLQLQHQHQLIAAVLLSQLQHQVAVA